MLVDEVGRGEPATAGSPLSVGRADVPVPQVPERASRRTYTAQYKLDVLAEYDRLDKNGKGALMRREGLYSSLLTEVPPGRWTSKAGSLVGPAERMFTWRLQEDHSRRSTGLRPLIG